MPSVDTENGESPKVAEKIEVNPEARDDQISRRLTEILQATDWFESADVTVDEGVVFLSGQTTDEKYREWASNLAQNTQDVVAVVNRIELLEKSVWDFSAAQSELDQLRRNAIQATPLILIAILILIATFILASITRRLSDTLLRKKISNSLLRWVAANAIVLPVILIGVYIVLRISGLTQLALTVLGGTGLLGLIIGIAFQDIAENFLASILISVQRPFRIGDLVRIAEHEGVVQRVTTRGTTLMTYNGNHIQIPNSKVYKNVIENFTANPLRRISFDVGIGYDDSATQAQNTVLKSILQHAATVNDPAPRVLIQGLGASTVNLRAYFWIDGTKNDHLSVVSSCMRIAKQQLLQAGISLPDESREILFPQGVPVMLENRASSEKESRSPQLDNRASHSRAESQENGATGPSQTHEKDLSVAEGNMASELDGLRRQAENSWQPEPGAQLLEADSASSPKSADSD